MNPLSQIGNDSAEAARARELAELVHKTKLGAHTEHKNDAQKAALAVKVFDTQRPSISTAAPKTIPIQGTTPPLENTAKSVLQSAQLADPILEHKERESKNVAQQASLQNQAANPVQVGSKPLERIAENKSLTSQSAVLHTLTQDMESLVRDRKVSMIRAVALESDKDASVARFAPQTTTPRSVGSIFSILAVLCGIFAVGIVGAGLYIRSQQTSDVPIEVKARYDSALVFFEHSQPFDVSDLADYELIGGLAHLRDTVPSSLGSMTSVDMHDTRYDSTLNSRTSYAFTLAAFIDQARLSLSDSLKRSLDGDYMLLIHQGEAPTPILLLRATEPDAAFAGMLAWESRMASNLSPLFPLGTLTLAETPPTFTDISLNNIDARVQYDGNQKIVLLYALLERNIIAITNSLTTMQEVASRLHTQLLKK